MKSFRYAIGLLLYLLATTLNAGNVYVSNSWLDGNIVTKGDDEGKYYVTVEGGNPSLHVHSVPEKTRQTFIARVPKGHEVTMWSWQDVKAAIGAGHYLNTYATNDYTYAWIGLNYDVALGVNLDWLKYTIDFDGNGETSGEAEPLEDVIYTNRITLAENPFTKTGYTFKEWQLEEDPTKSFSNKAKLKGEDFGDVLSHTNKEMTLVAQWTNNVYAVTFDANGGTFDGGAGTRALNEMYDEKYVLPDDPTRESYAFSGWTNILGVVSSDTKVTMPSNHTIFAKWTYVPPQMTVTFDPALPGVEAPKPIVVTYLGKYGDKGDLPTIKGYGYTFQGWYTEDTGGTKVTESTAVTKKTDHTLYAQWLPQTYWLGYEAMGGRGCPLSVKVTYGDKYPDLATPVRDGYTFVGWFTEKEGGYQVRKDDIVLTVREDTPSIYARWTANAYTISFEPNGGSGGPMADIEMKYDAVTNLPACAFSCGTRSFVNWLGSDGRNYADRSVVSNLTTKAGETFVLTAQWSDDYSVAFDGNGATGGSMPDQKFAKGEERSLSSNTYERIGYTYLGWATSETESAAWRVKFADGAKVRDLGKAGETVRLFAVWTNNPYRVRYYPNGGAGTAFERTFAYDIPQALPADAFTREGYELLGWTTDPTNTVMFGPSQSVSNLTTEANVVVPLFAKWQSVAEDLGAFSVAADCDRTTADRDALLLTAGDYCTVVSNVSEQLPGANKQYVCLSPTVNGQTTAILQCDRLSGQGKLSFDYRVQISFVPVYPTDPVSRFTCNVEESTTTNLVSVTTTSDGWVHVEYDKRTSGSVLAKWIFTTYYNADDHDYVHIDNVAWLPDERDAGTAGATFRLNDGTPAPADIWSNATYAVGKPVGDLPVLAVEGFKGWSTNVAASGKIDASWIVPATDSQLYAVWDSGEPPVPGPKDAPTIGGFASTADGFLLSFTSDARFDYRLLTTPILVPADWQPYGEVKQGTGEVLLFTVPGAESGGAEQGFFKVEVLRRGVE